MPDKNDPKWRPDDLPRNEREKSRYDPELEIPDPDQVEEDIERAEKEYGKDQGKKPAA